MTTAGEGFRSVCCCGSSAPSPATHASSARLLASQPANGNRGRRTFVPRPERGGRWDGRITSGRRSHDVILFYIFAFRPGMMTMLGRRSSLWLASRARIWMNPWREGDSMAQKSGLFWVLSG